MTNSIHAEIRCKLNDGTICDASKEELEKYAAALCANGANNSYGSTFHAVCGTIQTLLKSKISEEADKEARRIKEEIDSKRHREIQNKLDELKKSHWTVNPNFWFTSIAAISGVIGCLLTWHSSQQSKSSPPVSVQQSAMSTAQRPQKKPSLQQTEHKKLSPKSESYQSR